MTFLGKTRYDKINNVAGWLCFLIAAVTYLLTIEPTASFWDCPEFITQGAKLEVGHPPGNPIFMLTARFFVTIFGGGMTTAALAVNAMSALLSAATILLLFWSVTHLVRRLILKSRDSRPSAAQTVLIMASGLCAALAYTWSDTFWFSAVEGEVYAFSSFCTALVFWLILKWENRADMPHSDRYLILIAYVIGVSIAVHLLNLLCIPAIALVIYYRKAKESNVKGSLITLLVSFVVTGLILYGLVPGFIGVAKVFELIFTNGFGFGYNVGVGVYFFLTVAIFILAIRTLYRQRNSLAIKLLFFLAVFFSGMPFLGSSLWIGIILLLGLAGWLIFTKKLPIRLLNIVTVSIFVIFIGYSSYALLLIRSNAGVPMNQSQPDNVFALSSYLNREQYGERPLARGPVFAEELDIQEYEGQYYVMVDESGTPQTKIVDQYLRDSNGMPYMNEKSEYTKVVKRDPSIPDQYVDSITRPNYKEVPDLNMFLTRIYSTAPGHPESYKSWAEYRTPDLDDIPENVKQRWAEQGAAYLSDVMPYLHNMEEIVVAETSDGIPVNKKMVWKPGFGTNLKYFLNYQLNHMYWRYFMWNFAGRQNDIQGNGEPHLGNWISGIPVIDNARLGDQSLLPDEYGAGNKGHNVFYMFPLLLGLIGLLWQSLGSRNSKVGIEQFWVVFFMFFMTGIAIVLYLNQTPGQPRERDYAFAGSFYAFAIWIGIGIPAIAAGVRGLIRLVTGKKKTSNGEESAEKGAVAWLPVIVASVVAVAIPLQMVSQTWDDHDRSNRYTTRDLGENYLHSLAPNAIIFTNGDNDTFPLWYAQEVEGVRTDVKVVNLSYLTTDWYASLLDYPTYDAKPVDLYATPSDYRYERLGYSFVVPGTNTPVPAETALRELYKSNAKLYGAPYLTSPKVYMPTDSAEAMKTFITTRNPELVEMFRQSYMPIATDLSKMGSGINQSKVLSLDIISNSAAGNFKRPVYFANTVPESYYLGLSDYMYPTGMASQVTPFRGAEMSPLADKAYENIVTKFRFGGLDNKATNRGLYLDETVRRMVSSTRSGMLKTATDLMMYGDTPATEAAKEYARKNKLPEPMTHYDMARQIYTLILEKLPSSVMPLDGNQAYYIAEDLLALYKATGNPADIQLAKQIVDEQIVRLGQFTKYYASLSPSNRARVGRIESQNVTYLTWMIGLRNRIDLVEAASKPGAPELGSDITDVLGDNFEVSRPQGVYITLYARNSSPEDLEAALAQADNDYTYMTLTQALALAKAHRQLGVSYNPSAESLLKGSGLTMEEWTSASR